MTGHRQDPWGRNLSVNGRNYVDDVDGWRDVTPDRAPIWPLILAGTLIILAAVLLGLSPEVGP